MAARAPSGSDAERSLWGDREIGDLPALEDEAEAELRHAAGKVALEVVVQQPRPVVEAFSAGQRPRVGELGRGRAEPAPDLFRPSILAVLVVHARVGGERAQGDVDVLVV